MAGCDFSFLLGPSEADSTSRLACASAHPLKAAASIGSGSLKSTPSSHALTFTPPLLAVLLVDLSLALPTRCRRPPLPLPFRRSFSRGGHLASESDTAAAGLRSLSFSPSHCVHPRSAPRRWMGVRPRPLPPPQEARRDVGRMANDHRRPDRYQDGSSFIGRRWSTARRRWVGWREEEWMSRPAVFLA